MEKIDIITEKSEDFTGREWVFDRINTWLGSETPQHYFIAGDPGTGKSAISARLVQLFQHENPFQDHPHLKDVELVYSHFCRALDDATTNPLRFIEGLSLELAKRYPVFTEALLRAQGDGVVIKAEQTIGHLEGSTAQNVVIHELNIGTVPFRIAFDSCIRKPLEAVYSGECRDTILIVVDGLDEALYLDPAQNLITLLDHARSVPLSVRFLFTSRPDERVLRALGEPTIDLIKDAPSDIDDVQLYVLRRLADRLTGPDRNRLAIRIAEASKGVFLYARHVVDDLVQRDLWNVAIEEFPLPLGLNGIYSDFLNRELRENLKEWKSTYRPALGILAVAQGEGLTRDQLAGILGKPYSTVDDIIGSCIQFLRGPRPNGPFSIFHQSFREFLQAPGLCHVYPGEAHQAIAEHFFNKYCDDWRLCKEEYALRNTPHHFAAAIKNIIANPDSSNLRNKLTELLLDYRFIAAKTHQFGIGTLIPDYNPLANETDASFVQEALRLSANFIDRDSLQLPSQLYGRLMGLESSRLKNLCNQIVESTDHPWFRSCFPSFIPPGTAVKNIFPSTSPFFQPMAITPDGRMAVTVSESLGALSVWDLETSRSQDLNGHLGRILALAITPDGHTIVSGSSDLTVRVWNKDTGESQELLGHTQWVTAMAITPDSHTVVSGCGDHTVRVWDKETGESQELCGHTEFVKAVAITDDGQTIASGSMDKTVRVWNLGTSKSWVLKGHTGLIRAVAIARDCPTVVSGADDGTVRVWDLDTGRSWELIGHTEGVTAVAISADGNTVVSGSIYGALRIWDINSETFRELAGHGSSINAVAISADQSWVTSGSSYDNTLRRWNLAIGAFGEIPKHTTWVTAVAITPESQVAVSGSEDRTVRVWDLETGMSRELAGHANSITTVAITPDGSFAVSGSIDMAVRVWDLKTFESREFTGHTDIIRSVAIASDGNIVVSGSDDGSLRVWILDPFQSQVLSEHKGPVTAVAIIAESRKVVSGSADRTLRVWDLDSFESRELKGHNDTVTTVAIANDGQSVISGAYDRTLRVWNPTNGGCRVIGKQTTWVAEVAVAPDGKIAVSRSDDRILRIWDLSTDKPPLLAEHAEPIRAVAVIPEGSRIVSASDDGTLRVWDPMTGMQVAGFIFGRRITSCATSRGGKIIIGGGRWNGPHSPINA